MEARFRYLNGDEAFVVAQFVSETPGSEQGMKQLLERLRMEFALAAPLSPEQELARRKLLDIAGVYQLIDVKDMRRRLSAHQIVAAPQVPKATPDLRVRTQISPAALPLIPGFARLLELARWPGEVTYGGTFSAIRDEDGAEMIDWIVFDRDLTLDCGSDVSSSSEPLTRTIFIKSRAAEEELRDPVSMFFDLVLQAAYLKVFCRTLCMLDREQTKYEMLQHGLEFALDVLRMFFSMPAGQSASSADGIAAPYAAFISSELVFGTVEKMNRMAGPGRDPDLFLQHLLWVKGVRLEDLERLRNR